MKRKDSKYIVDVEVEMNFEVNGDLEIEFAEVVKKMMGL